MHLTKFEFVMKVGITAWTLFRKGKWNDCNWCLLKGCNDAHKTKSIDSNEC